jgi:nucleoside recognition membrane protein YjiH
MQGALANIVKGLKIARVVLAVASLLLASLLGFGKPVASVGPAVSILLAGAALFVRAKLTRLYQEMTYVGHA